eukprot:1495074-Pleurochrysis_carterae.AAC.3
MRRLDSTAARSPSRALSHPLALSRTPAGPCSLATFSSSFLLSLFPDLPPARLTLLFSLPPSLPPCVAFPTSSFSLDYHSSFPSPSHGPAPSYSVAVSTNQPASASGAPAE